MELVALGAECHSKVSYLYQPVSLTLRFKKNQDSSVNHSTIASYSGCDVLSAIGAIIRAENKIIVGGFTYLLCTLGKCRIRD